MINVLITGIIICGVVTGYISYQTGLQEGFEKGRKNAYDEVFTVHGTYMALKDLEPYAEELMNKGYTGQYPLCMFTEEELPWS